MDIVLRRLWCFRFAIPVVVLAITTVASAQIRLVKPVGGEVYYTAGEDPIMVEWTGVAPETPVEVNLSSNEGATWTTLTRNARGLSYAIPLRDLPVGTTYRVRVVDRSPIVVYTRGRRSAAGGSPRDISWNPSGTRLSFGGVVWDINSIEEPTRIAAGAEMTAWAPHGDLLLVDNNRDIVIFDTTTFQQRRRIRLPASGLSSNDVVEARWQPGSRGFAVGYGSTVDYYSNDSQQVPRRFTLESWWGPIGHIEWAPDGASLAFTTQLTVGVIQPFSPGSEARWVHKVHQPFRPSWSPVEPVFAGPISRFGSVVLWNGDDGGQTVLLQDWDDTPLRNVVCMNGGEWLALLRDDGSLLLLVVEEAWFAAKYDLGIPVPERGSSLAIHPNRKDIAVATADGRVLRINTDAGTVENVVPAGWTSSHDTVIAMRWNADGSALALSTTSGMTIIINDKTVGTGPSSDSSAANFTILGSNPGVARFITNGGRVDIGDTIAVDLRLSGGTEYHRHGVDSVMVTVTFGGSMLSVVDAAGGTVTVAGEQRTIALPAVALPLSDDSVVARIRLRAVLGSDSVTMVTVTDVRTSSRRAATAVPMDFVTDAEAITITGICREGDEPRLYEASGGALTLRGRRTTDGSVRVDVTLSDDGPATLQVVDAMGRVLVMDAATAEERLQRTMVRHYDPRSIGSNWVVAVLQSETGRQTLLIGW